MRKIMIALMAALLLCAMLVAPVCAATVPSGPIHAPDGSTAQQVNSENMDLVVTEVMCNSSNSYIWAGDVKAPHYDAFTYIELYNRGTEEIKVSDLALVSYRDIKQIDDGGNLTHDFYTDRFESKIPINDGSIYAEIHAAGTVQTPCVNDPAGTVIAPGEFVILWIWNNDTVTVDRKCDEELGMPQTVGGEQVYHYYFRQHYGLDNDIKIMAVYTGTTYGYSYINYGGTAKFLSQSANYVYGLVEDYDTTDGRFDVNTERVFERVYYPDGSSDTTLNGKVLCTWKGGSFRANSLPSFGDFSVSGADGVSRWNSSLYEDYATLYAPAGSDPFYYNAQRAVYNTGYVPKRDYVEIGSNYVHSYKEMAVMCPTVRAGAQTIGKMDDAQLSQVDAYAAELKADLAGVPFESWTAQAKAAFLNGRLKYGTGEVPAHPETALEINLGTTGSGMQNHNAVSTSASSLTELPAAANAAEALLGPVCGTVLLAALCACMLTLLLRARKSRKE